MPTISRKALSAIEAVVYIACKPGTPIRSKEISKYQGVAERYLEPIMQEFVHQRILRGVRGPKGGYVLAKERRKVTLKEIIGVVESMENNKREGKSPLSKKVVTPLWRKANSAATAVLGDITLQDLCEEAVNSGILSQGDKPDFNI